MYAYLQKRQNSLAEKQLAYLDTIQEIHPANFKVAYAFAAMPSRYVLENKAWQQAATLALPQKNFSWNEFPWQKAIIHFTRMMGAIHTGNKAAVNPEHNELKRLHNVLLMQKDNYKAKQVEVQIKTVEAWMHFKDGRSAEAVVLMQEAADLEDKTEKHPVTPTEVIPAREFLGDMLLQMNQPTKALQAYKLNLKKHSNRFNGLYGAGIAAERCGLMNEAKTYYRQLLTIADKGSFNQPETDKGVFVAIETCLGYFLASL